MSNNELMENLSKLGLPMFQPSEEVNAKETLAEVVKAHDTRLWEVFPVLLANVGEKYNLNIEEVDHLLSDKDSKSNFHFLLIMSWSLYSLYHLKFSWLNQCKNYLTTDDKHQIKIWRNHIAHDEFISWHNTKINPIRLKKSFQLYFVQTVEKTRQQKDKSDEFSLAFSLSQIFSPKQIELFKKKIDGVTLTKTEQEYYSRSVKKKVVALANSELHNMARKLLEQA